MNNNEILNKYFIWEEKNYTKPNQNNYKLEEKDSCVTMNETKNDLINNDWKNITDVKIGIYKIVNKVDDKYYVGSSKNIIKRWRTHKNDLNKNIHHNDYLQRAWNKHGEQSFEFIIIESIDSLKSTLLEVEQRYLDIAKTEQNKCYNLNFDSSGGELSEYSRLKLKHRYFSETHRRKISESKIGKSRSKETIKKLKTSHLGKRLSEETKQKISKSNLGRKLSEETKLKISNNRTGIKFSDIHKKNISLNNWKRDYKVYKFYNKITKEECCLNRVDFINKYGTSDLKRFKNGIDSIFRVYNKLNKQWAYKGWIIVGLIQ